MSPGHQGLTLLWSSAVWGRGKAPRAESSASFGLLLVPRGVHSARGCLGVKCCAKLRWTCQGVMWGNGTEAYCPTCDLHGAGWRLLPVSLRAGSVPWSYTGKPSWLLLSVPSPGLFLIQCMTKAVGGHPELGFQQGRCVSDLLVAGGLSSSSSAEGVSLPPLRCSWCPRCLENLPKKNKHSFFSFIHALRQAASSRSGCCMPFKAPILSLSHWSHSLLAAVSQFLCIQCSGDTEKLEVLVKNVAQYDPIEFEDVA